MLHEALFAFEAGHLRESGLGAELRGLRLPGSVLASQMDSMSVLTLLLCPGCPLLRPSSGSRPGPADLSVGLLSCSSMSRVACVRLSSEAFLLLCTQHTSSEALKV